MHGSVYKYAWIVISSKCKYINHGERLCRASVECYARVRYCTYEKNTGFLIAVFSPPLRPPLLPSLPLSSAQFCFCSRVAEWPWASQLLSVGLGFSICPHYPGKHARVVTWGILSDDNWYTKHFSPLFPLFIFTLSLWDRWWQDEWFHLASLERVKVPGSPANSTALETAPIWLMVIQANGCKVPATLGKRQPLHALVFLLCQFG